LTTATGGTVTLLFTDLVGSTEVLGRLGDDAYEGLRRTHFRLLRDAVAARGGHEVKTLGDGLMAVFPSALDAIACAIAMQQAVHRHNSQEAIEQQLHVRVGLEAGEPIRHEDDYFGTPVVVAKRLCDGADGGQIRASQLVRLLIGSRGGYAFRELGTLDLRGLADPVVAFEVSWEPSAAGSEGADAALGPPSLLPPSLLAGAERTAFVGRERELVELRRAWERARTGERELVLLSGDAGIGKTRLAIEFARGVHNEGAVVLIGRADEEPLVACQPFVEALREYAAGGAVGARRARAEAIADDLAQLSAEPAEATAERLSARAFDRASALLGETAQQGPLLLVLDDLQWADRPGLQLVKRLLRPAGRSAGEPLLIIGTYHETDLGDAHPLAELIAGLRRDHAFRRIALTGLSEYDVGALIGAWADGALPQAFARAVHQQTEGNPFFIEELLRHLAESGIPLTGDMAAATEALLSVPEGVKEVIRRRLLRVSEECNSVLTIASVIGRHFGLDALERASALPQHRLLELLDEAVTARAITEVPQAVGQYSFAHALIHETLYDELTTTRRVRLHGQTLQYADSNGVKLAYEVLGASGPYLVAVGLSNCPAVRTRSRVTTQRWEPIIRRCRLVLYDRRGVGFSAAPERGYSLMASVGDLRAVLDAAGAERAIIWGAADGGPLAIAFAAQYPERVAGLLLLGTTAKYASDDDFPSGVSRAVIESFQRTDSVDRTRAVSGLTHTRPDMGAAAIIDVMGRVPARVWSKVIMGVGAADVRHLLPNLRVPTLIIHDPENNYIPVAAAYYLHEHIADSRLEINEEWGAPLFGESVYRLIEGLIDEVTGHGGL